MPARKLFRVRMSCPEPPPGRYVGVTVRRHIGRSWRVAAVGRARGLWHLLLIAQKGLQNFDQYSYSIMSTYYYKCVRRRKEVAFEPYQPIARHLA